MPPHAPRPPLPPDDLYARLGVPVDASVEAIEIAWRALLRRHHPDVAGPDGLDEAKRINVAHDWLCDPALRARYDRERLGVDVRDGDDRGGWAGAGRGRGPRSGAWRPRPGAGSAAGSAPPRRPPATIEERVAAVVERVGRLGRDDLDRLALAEPAPIAFLATIRRFVTPEQAEALDAATRDVVAALPPDARRRLAVREAVIGRVAELVLGDALDELLGGAAGGRARERLARGWDAAVGQPRYGPATATVGALIDRLGRLTPDELRGLAATGARERLGDEPWPDSTSREEDEVLRVSSELAGDDAAAALPVGGANAAARRAAARVAHLLVLRHAFPARSFARHAGPWLGTLIEPDPGPRTRVNHTRV